MSPHRAPSWTPFFEGFPRDYVPPPDAFAAPDAPLVRFVNLLLLDMMRRRYAVRLTPNAPRDRAVFFAEGRVLSSETPSAALLASLLTRLREMAGLDLPPPAVGRISLRLGAKKSAVFVVHACLTVRSERLVVSHLRGMTFSEPSAGEVSTVQRIARLLEKGRQGEDVVKLARAREEAARIGGSEGARLGFEASMALGRLCSGDAARRHYERALELARGTDAWNVGAALDCLAALRAEAGEPPLASFSPLFDHLETAFGPLEPVTLGWKCDAIERMMEDKREAARASWSRLRGSFVGAFGGDDVTVARLDAK